MHKHAHTRGVRGHVPPGKFWYSEITSETIFALKLFIFELDATRIPGLSPFGVPLAMLHGSRSLLIGLHDLIHPLRLD